MKTSQDIRKAFVDFWTSSPRDHKQIQNSSLVPIGDSTILFVNSGMFPLVPYLSGEQHPLGKRLVNFQRSLRTADDEIQEIGDNRHTLLFEMMGNWSLGDYFKKEQLPWMMELYHEHFGLDINRLYVTVFAGDDNAPRDEESIEIWKQVFAKYGITAKVSDNPQDLMQNFDEEGNLKDESESFRIFTYPAKKNWWQRGQAPGELGGPDSEIFFDLGPSAEAWHDPELHVNSDNGRFLEIGNSVFMQFKLDDELSWKELEQKNVDFGGGFERVVMAVQEKSDIFDIDVFVPVINKISELTSKSYKNDDGSENEFTKAFRIVADHCRVSTFILADGITPSNKDQGYILRRFIRRMATFGTNRLGLPVGFSKEVASTVIDVMGEAYPHLFEQKDHILTELETEEIAFSETLKKGLKQFFRLFDGQLSEDTPMDSSELKARLTLKGSDAFNLLQTYGLPEEIIRELTSQYGVDFDESGFQTELESHRSRSREGAEKKFKGGLADHSEEVTKLHTAHHLLLKALQIVLGEHVHQRGSNITGERLRIDFSHNQKLTDEQIKEVEHIVNHKIDEGLDVVGFNIEKSKAEEIGAEMEFGQSYPETVNVYVITSDSSLREKAERGEDIISELMSGDVFSKEFCGGPHVSNTSELGEGGKRFKIQKQESSSSGVRRIKAVLE